MRISGIYKLVFPDGQFYIGKSVDIERRYSEHKESLIKGTAAKKLQTAYILSGLPSIHILVECHPDHIDLMESAYILLDTPGLNTNVPIKLGTWELSVLCNNTSFLTASTAEHINRLRELQQQLTAKNQTIAELDELVTELAAERTKEEIESTVGNKLAILQHNLNVLVEKNNSLEIELAQEKSKTIWKRIFGN